MQPSWIQTAFLIAFLSGGVAAQTARFEQLEGGFVTWPWLWNDPADPDHFLVWTAEDGARIRITDFSRTPGGFATNGSAFVPQNGAAYREIFRHIRLATADGFVSGGVAVGDEGQWSWLGPHERWINEPHLRYQGAATPQDLWETAALGDGTTWVVGSAGLIQRVIGPRGTEDRAAPTAFVEHDPRVAGLTLRGIDVVDLPGSGMRGIAVGDVGRDPVTGQPVADEGLIYWTEDGVTWHNADFGTAPVPAGQPLLALFDVAFVPGNPDVAIAVGGISDDEGPGVVYRTLDGGKHWALEGICSDCSNTTWCDEVPAACTCTSLRLPSKNAGMLTLYGVHAFADTGAVAVGYGAQVLRRIASCFDDPPSECVAPWVDVSWNCDQANVPLWGVHAAEGSDTVVLSGMFGSLRVSDRRGARAEHLGWNRFWRFGEVCFIDEETGWVAGQHHRIALTVDGGATWEEQYAQYGANEWAALDFHRDGGGPSVANGVAVGKAAPVVDPAHPPGPGVSRSIAFTLSGGTDGGSPCDPCATSPTVGGWMPASVPVGLEGVALNDVACAGTSAAGNEFWAVGNALDGSQPAAERTLVLHSADYGMTWQKIAGPPLAAGALAISWSGVTFPSTDLGFFVGRQGALPVAYRLEVGAPQPWVELGIWREPGERSAPRLRAVDSAGAHVFAVGDDGCVLEYSHSASSFEGVPGTAGLTAHNLHSVQVVLDGRGAPHVFAGGAGGTVVRHAPGTVPPWTLDFGRTSNTLTGLSFVGPDLGFGIGTLGVDAPRQTTLVRFGPERTR